ncbi:unnamed protein product, partial [Symbiodinium microadriaticum]
MPCHWFLAGAVFSWHVPLRLATATAAGCITSTDVDEGDCEFRDPSVMMQTLGHSLWGKTKTSSTTTMSATTERPDYNVELTSSKTGKLDDVIAKTWLDAENWAVQVLKRLKFIEETDHSCSDCLSPPSGEWICCFERKVDGATVIATVDVPIMGAQLVVRLQYEEDMDSDLAAYTHSLHLEPRDRRVLAQNFKQQGVYQKSQLKNRDPADIFNGIQRSELTKSKFSDVQAQAQAMKQELEAARTKMEEASKSGNAALASEAQAQLNQVMSQLDGVAVGNADLSTSGQQAEMNKAIQSGGFVNGHALTTSQLIAMNGVFRGMNLFTDEPTALKAQAVELVPQYAQMSEDQLALYVEMRPEVDSEEFFIESQKATDLQVANGMVDAFGSSAFHTSVDSWQAAVDIQSSYGGGGASGGQSKSKSGGSAQDHQDSDSKRLETSIKTLAKSQYFLQPKLLIDISESMLQMSPSFQADSHQASYVLCVSQGRQNCSSFLHLPAPNSNSSTPDASQAGSSGSSLEVRFLVTNVENTIVLSQAKLRSDMESAFGDFIAFVAHAPNVSARVELYRPARAFSPDGTFTSIQVVVTLSPADFATYSNVETYHAKGRLQPYCKKILLSIPHIDQARIRNASNPINFLDNDLSYFFVSWSPLTKTGKTGGTFDFIGVPEPGLVQDDQVVPALLYNYGSHVCPHVTMGGWWRITANYASTVSQQRLQVEVATAQAMEKARAEAWGVDATAAGSKPGTASGGASGGTSHSKGSDDNSHSSDGSKDAELSAMKNATMEIEQTWKGGAPGVAPQNWRRSLDESMNSNWKAIQRDLTRCIGIWSFVKDPKLGEALCEAWVASFLKAQKLSNTSVPLVLQQAACSTTKNMQHLISYARNASAWKQKEEQQQGEMRCEREQPGTYWSPPDRCVKKQCFCSLPDASTASKGTSGIDCPANGETDCLGCCTNQQRSRCSKSACAFNHVLKSGAAGYFCQLATCHEQYDDTVCCTPKYMGRHFSLEFQVSSKDDCGTDSDIYGQLEGSNWKGKKQLLESSADDFQQGKQESFVYDLADPRVPTKICVENKGDDELCLDWVKIYNLDAEEPALVGKAGGWPPLSDDDGEAAEPAQTRGDISILGPEAMSRPDKRSHRGALDLDLGLSDDEDDDAGRVGGGSAKREESIGELLGDSKELKFGVPARQRRQQGFRLGGGVDPLQALVDQTRPPITEDDEPDSEFEREFERAVAGAASSMPARPAPPEPSAEPAGDDLDDIVGEIGDILGDEQLTSARRTLRRSQTAPTAALDHHTAELE